MPEPSVTTLAADLSADLRRWREEVSAATLRSTLGIGMLSRATERAEALLREAVRVLQEAAPTETAAAHKRAAEGKPLDRLTFGQTVKVIEQVSAATRLAGGKRLARPSDIQLLNRLSGLRNDLVHGRYESLLEEGSVGTETFLREVSQLCESELLQHIRRLETGTQSLDSRPSHGRASD